MLPQSLIDSIPQWLLDSVYFYSQSLLLIFLIKVIVCLIARKINENIIKIHWFYALWLTLLILVLRRMLSLSAEILSSL